MKPRVCIIKTDGTNCDEETAYAFTKAGGHSHIVTLHQLRTKQKTLDEFDVLAIPGGFSYGDDIASGTIFALELRTFLHDQLAAFIAQKKLIIGICNGFQVLVRSGLLPFNTLGNQQATLTDNTSGKFECRWVTMHIELSPCIFTQGLENTEVTFQAAHAEGNYFAQDNSIAQLEQEQLVVLRYTPNQYPNNPNGAQHGIAGVCDSSGHIFGLMPHPERFVEKQQHPNWRRNQYAIPHGLKIFENAVQYVR